MCGKLQIKIYERQHGGREAADAVISVSSTLLLRQTSANEADAEDQTIVPLTQAALFRSPAPCPPSELKLSTKLLDKYRPAAFPLTGKQTKTPAGNS